MAVCGSTVSAGRSAALSAIDPDADDAAVMPLRVERTEDAAIVGFRPRYQTRGTGGRLASLAPELRGSLRGPCDVRLGLAGLEGHFVGLRIADNIGLGRFVGPEDTEAENFEGVGRQRQGCERGSEHGCRCKIVQSMTQRRPCHKS
jgi:hypothetical protein